MIGIVVVSHSRPLAEAAVALALQMGGDDPPRVLVAAGAGDETGTDATAIADAIDALEDTGGVLVVMDLGSALLSAELALELRSGTVPVRLSTAPFIEGLVAAVVQAAGGATLDAVDREARGALAAKQAQLEDPADAVTEPVPSGAAASDTARGQHPDDVSAAREANESDADGTVAFDVVVRNPTGLHARPAAQFAKTVAGYDAQVVVSTDARGPVNAASLVGLLTLGVRSGDAIHVAATGPDAAEAIAALRTAVESGLGE